MIEEQTSLFEQWVVDGSNDVGSNTDSFGNVYSNSICHWSNGSQCIYNLKNKFKYLKLEYAAGRDCDLSKSGSFTIDADGVTVFISDEIKKNNTHQKSN